MNEELRQQILEGRQLARAGLLIFILGPVLIFAGMYVHRGREIGYSKTNQEIIEAVRYKLKQWENSPMLRFIN